MAKVHSNALAGEGAHRPCRMCRTTGPVASASVARCSARSLTPGGRGDKPERAEKCLRRPVQVEGEARAKRARAAFVSNSHNAVLMPFSRLEATAELAHNTN